MVTVSTICGKSSLGRIENQLCAQSGSMSAMFARCRGCNGDVRQRYLAGDAVVAVVEVTRVGGGDGEGDRLRPAVRLALVIASRRVPSAGVAGVGHDEAWPAQDGDGGERKCC